MIYIKWAVIHAHSETVTVFRDNGAGKQHVQSFYTKRTHHSCFQLFVSQVLLCDSIWSNAVVLLHSSVPLSTLFMDIILIFFLSLSCSVIHVTPLMFLYSSQNITPVDVTLPIL